MNKRWPLVRLAGVLMERHEVPSEHDLTLGHVRIVSKISFDTGQIELRAGSGTKTGMILARPGDLLISGINAAKGAIAVYGPENSDPIAATIHYGAYTPRPEIADLKYLWWFFRSQPFRGLLLRHVPGGIKTELKASRLLPIPIPLPDLPEQRRVVSQLGDLSAKIREARTLREQTAEEAEALLSTELAAVFRRESSRVGGTTLESLIADARYGTSEKCERERLAGSTPVLRIPNVAAERVSLNDLKYAELDGRDRERLMLTEGDILVVRTNGSLELVGRSAVVPKLDEPFAFASYMIRLRLDSERIIPAYAQRMLQHLRVAGVLVDFARTTAGQYNVSLGRLRTAEIPVPHLPEQRRIVAELDALQAQVDSLKRLQAETTTELEALMPAVLSSAFSGLL